MALLRFPTRLSTAFSRFNLSLWLTQIGLLVTLAFLTIALLAPLFQHLGWLVDPTEFLDHPPLQAPSPQHWFGTTRLGYDVFSRTVFGTQAAWQVVALATLFSLGLGVPLGMVSGYLGGRLDRILLFLMDAVYTLPTLLIAVTLAFVLGRGVLNAAIALSIAYIPQYFRLVRNQTVSVKTELFVEAAQAMGASTWHIMTRYLFLNVVQSVPVLLTLNIADAVLILGGLGFLGLGLPEETPEWGYDLKQALDGLSTGDVWWTTLFPGLAMTAMVTGLSLLGEGLGDLLNPLEQRDNG